MIECVRAAALEVPGVMGVDKTYARGTGFGYHVDLHIEVDPEVTVAAAHGISGAFARRYANTSVGWPMSSFM